MSYRPDWSEWILQKNNEARQEELKKSDKLSVTNEMIDKIGLGNALNHDNWSIASAAAKHPNFKQWVDTHIKNVGIKNALAHENTYVREAAAEHDGYIHWLKNANIEDIVNHPNPQIEVDANAFVPDIHEKLNNYVNKIGIDSALNHDSGLVRDAAQKAHIQNIF